MNIKEMYKEKLSTAQQIAEQVESGWLCSVEVGPAIPVDLMNAIGDRAIEGSLTDVDIEEGFKMTRSIQNIEVEVLTAMTGV